MHAQLLIVQFMAACCGKNSGRDDDGPDDGEARDFHKTAPDNTLPLARVHTALDRMSAKEEKIRKRHALDAREEARHSAGDGAVEVLEAAD